nr:ribonuclease H-like domain-containing protein [Tanacetum cinerariifolium]
MAFISSSKNSSGNEDGNIPCVSTSLLVPVLLQSAKTLLVPILLLSPMTRKKISIQGSDVAGFDKLKVECYNCHKMGHFARECRAPRSQERGRKENYRQGSKAEEKTPKALMAIDGVGWDWSYIKIKDLTGELSEANNYIYHYKLAVAQLEGRLVEYKEREVKYIEKIRTLEMYRASNLKCIKTLDKELEELKLEKNGLDGKLAGLLKASKNLDNLIESQRSNKFVKSKDSQSESKTDKQETPKKPQVKNAEQYRHSNKKPNVKGNQRNWNNLKSYQLGPEFVLNKKACFNCGDFSYLANDCRKMVQRDITRSQKHAYESPLHIFGGHRLHGAPMRPPHRSDGHRPHGASMRPSHRPTGHRPHGPSMNPTRPNMNSARPNRSFFIQGSSQNNIDDKGYWDSGCSRHITCSISYLSYFEPFDGGQHNMYSIDLNNIVPHKDLTCLVAKASTDECILWHRRLGHLNVKTMNKLVRHNLVRGLPTKSFDNDHTCTACLKGKQHKASCKSKVVNSVTKPLYMLHIDLFGPTSVSSISHKWYSLVVTNDFSRFTWTFFLRSKDETSDILKKFITEIENLKELKVKIVKCDNGGEFRNMEINDFCSQKGIKREFSNARTPQQNGVAERRNRTLIEAARTMLVDAKLPVTFWAEAVNTACYVQNRVLVNKSQNKTPYELFNVDAGTNFTNFLGTNDAGNQEVKKDVSSLGYILLPNWAHDAFLETSSSKPHDESNTKIPKGSGNSNPTTSSSNPPANQMETLTVESPIPTVSSPVLIACLNDSLEPSSKARLISKRVANQEESPSLDNILSLTNRFEAILRVTTSSNEAIGVEANNKKDERGIVVKNKAKLVGQGHTQEERIDYDEVFAPVARIEAIRLFVAYASFMGFTVYQMDVKSAFLYGTIDEEVYVMQPLGFQDLAFPAKVCKVEKTMYGLHQAPRAWYGTLSKYLLMNGFQMGTMDQTLFIRRQKEDFILVQVYVDDIIFGSSNPQLCREFEALMHENFQMSDMGELNFFLGLQVL